MKDGMTNGHTNGWAEGGRWLPGMSANPSGPSRWCPCIQSKDDRRQPESLLSLFSRTNGPSFSSAWEAGTRADEVIE